MVGTDEELRAAVREVAEAWDAWGATPVSPAQVIRNAMLRYERAVARIRELGGAQRPPSEFFTDLPQSTVDEEPTVEQADTEQGGV